MPRVISRALTLITRTPRSSLLPTRASISLKRRHTVAEGALIEIDLDTSTTETGDSGAGRIVRIEDLMHTIIAQRSAPSWLPFIPGSSYWVPPSPSAKNVENLLNKCSSGPMLSAEEALSLTTVRGSPSSELQSGLLGNVLRSPSEVKLKDSKTADTEVQLKVVGVISKEEDNE